MHTHTHFSIIVYIHLCTHTNFRSKESQFTRVSLENVSEGASEEERRASERSTIVQERRGLRERGKRDHFGIASGDVEIDQDKL